MTWRRKEPSIRSHGVGCVIIDTTAPEGVVLQESCAKYLRMFISFQMYESITHMWAPYGPGQKGHFKGAFELHFLEFNLWYFHSNLIFKFVFEGPTDSESVLVQVMAWCRPGDKPLSESMVNWMTHICVTRPRTVNSSPLNKMAAISQTTFSSAFSWMKSVIFRFKFHWRFSQGSH